MVATGREHVFGGTSPAAKTTQCFSQRSSDPMFAVRIRPAFRSAFRRFVRRTAAGFARMGLVRPLSLGAGLGSARVGRYEGTARSGLRFGRCFGGLRPVRISAVCGHAKRGLYESRCSMRLPAAHKFGRTTHGRLEFIVHGENLSNADCRRGTDGQLILSANAAFSSGLACSVPSTVMEPIVALARSAVMSGESLTRPTTLMCRRSPAARTFSSSVAE